MVSAISNYHITTPIDVITGNLTLSFRMETNSIEILHTGESYKEEN
jgi:hypothetical protein